MKDVDSGFFLSRRSLCQSCYFLISSLSPILEDNNCSHIQQQLHKALQGMNGADLAITGSAHSSQAEEWMPILIQNCSVQVI